MAALKAAGCLLLVGMYFAADSSSPLADSRQPLAAAPSLAAEPSSAAAGASPAGSPSDPPPLRLSLTVALFLLRGGLANSTTPLSSALLMDSVAPGQSSLGGRHVAATGPGHVRDVSRRQRARWAGVGGNLVKVSWAASAAAGGVLADRYGYRAAFLLTAALQGLGTALLLLPVFPRAEYAGAAARDVGPSGLVDPLLPRAGNESHSQPETTRSNAVSEVRGSRSPVGSRLCEGTD